MRILVTAIAFLFVLPAARAADIEPQPAPRAAVVPSPTFNWSGFYIGVNGGYGSAAGTSVLTAPGLFATSTGDNISGGLAGGQAGFNAQMGMAVVGLEADYQWTGFSKTVLTGCGFACTISERVRLTSFGTVRGRLGIAADRVLVYATGGAAYITADDEATLALGALTGSLGKVSLSGWGWTVGGGLEAALGAGWTAKGEYLYLSTSDLSGQGNIAVLGPVQLNVKAHAHIGRAGINYKF